MPTTPRPGPLLWRFIAFDIDYVVISLIVQLVGVPLFERLSDLGDYGRLIGAALVALYFGFFDSEFGGGRSPGKWLVGLKVVSTSSGPVTPLRAAARALIATAPILIDGVPVAGQAETALVDLLTIGLEASLIYLAMFNRPSRRTLHDLLTATAVTAADASPPAPLPLRQLHQAIVAGLAILAVAGPPVAERAFVPALGAYDTDAIAERVAAAPEVASVEVNVAQHWTSADPRWRPEVEVVAELRHWPDDRTAIAKAALAAISSGDEKLLTEAPVSLELWRGYTLGITERFKSERFPLAAKTRN
jgi:uncharacterized RDD family membrane protein YckC